MRLQEDCPKAAISPTCASAESQQIAGSQASGFRRARQDCYPAATPSLGTSIATAIAMAEFNLRACCGMQCK